jgi:pyruvate dehydrogenase E1 component beta subunit
LFIWHRGLMMSKEEVPDSLAPADVPTLKNAAKIVKAGSDLTVVAYQRSLKLAEAAAAEVEAETGKTIEIIDPRVLIPFDKEKLFASLKKTGRLLVAHDAPATGGFGAQIVTWAVEKMGTELKGNPVSVCGRNTVIPFGALEGYVVPQKDDLKAGMKKALGV